jgi:hypothetical protein
MNNPYYLVVAFVIGLFILSYLSNQAAYRNGVNDGYGFSKDPTHPGYEHCRQILGERGWYMGGK